MGPAARTDNEDENIKINELTWASTREPGPNDQTHLCPQTCRWMTSGIFLKHPVA